MSVQPVWIRPSVRPSVPGSGTKPTSRTRPGACDTSLEPSRQKKSIHEKKIPLRARAPVARVNVLRLLHKLPQNNFLELWIIRIS